MERKKEIKSEKGKAKKPSFPFKLRKRLPIKTEHQVTWVSEKHWKETTNTAFLVDVSCPYFYKKDTNGDMIAI